METANQQWSEPQASGTAGRQWIGAGARAGRLDHPGGIGRQAVRRGEGEYRVRSWPGDDTDTVIYYESLSKI